jgi:hypothetical protein
MAQAARAAVTFKIGLKGYRVPGRPRNGEQSFSSGQRSPGGIILASVAMCLLQVCAATRSAVLSECSSMPTRSPYVDEPSVVTAHSITCTSDCVCIYCVHSLRTKSCRGGRSFCHTIHHGYCRCHSSCSPKFGTAVSFRHLHEPRRDTLRQSRANLR